SETRVCQRRSVRERHSRHRLVTVVHRHHIISSFRLPFDVDLDVLDPGPLQLTLEPAAVPTPGCRVHRDLRCHCYSVSARTVASPAIRITTAPSAVFPAYRPPQNRPSPQR